MNFKFLLFVISILIISACSGSDSQDINQNAINEAGIDVLNSTEDFPFELIRFEEKQRYGESNEVYLPYINDFDVDHLGRVYLAEAGEFSNPAVHVFNENGKYLNTLGSYGRGPGEFEIIKNIQIKGDKLYVFENYDIHIFDISTMDFLSTEILEKVPDSFEVPLLIGWDFHANPDETFTIEFMGRIFSGENEERIKYYLEAKGNGTIHEKPLAQIRDYKLFDTGNVPAPGVPLPFTMPFTRSSLAAFNSEGDLYTVWTESFEFQKYNRDGSLSQTFKFPYKNSGLTKEQAVSLASGSGRKNYLGGIDLPETWPAIHNIFTDDEDRLWVAAITESDSLFNYYIFDKGGNLWSKFELSGRKAERIVEIKERVIVKDGHLYKREENNKAGEVEVVKYKIEFTERRNE